MEYTGLDILEIRKKFKWTQKELAQRIGVSYKTILNYEKGGPVSATKWEILDKIIKEAETNQEIISNIEHQAEFLTDIFRDDIDIIKRIDGTTFSDLGDGTYLMTMPLVEHVAYAGYMSGYNDPEFLEDLPRHAVTVQKQHFGLYRAFRVRGDSMDNDRRHAICNGDIVAGRQIDKKYWKSKFHLHKFEDYIIVHQEGILVKRIVNHDVENGVITCHSLNEDKTAYPDFDLPLKEIYELYNIVSVESKRG